MFTSSSIIRRGEQCFFRGQLEKYGLLPMEGLTLYSVRKFGPCNQDTLCLHLEIDKGRMAKLMAHLEERSFIQRVVNQRNRREKQIALTQEGQQVVDAILQAFHKWSLICFNGFSPEEQALYRSMLDRIAENVSTYRKEEKKHDEKFD